MQIIYTEKTEKTFDLPELPFGYELVPMYSEELVQKGWRYCLSRGSWWWCGSNVAGTPASKHQPRDGSFYMFCKPIEVPPGFTLVDPYTEPSTTERGEYRVRKGWLSKNIVDGKNWEENTLVVRTAARDDNTLVFCKPVGPDQVVENKPRLTEAQIKILAHYPPVPSGFEFVDPCGDSGKLYPEAGWRYFSPEDDNDEWMDYVCRYNCTTTVLEHLEWINHPWVFCRPIPEPEKPKFDHLIPPIPGGYEFINPYDDPEAYSNTAPYPGLKYFPVFDAVRCRPNDVKNGWGDVTVEWSNDRILQLAERRPNWVLFCKPICTTASAYGRALNKSDGAPKVK